MGYCKILYRSIGGTFCLVPTIHTGSFSFEGNMALRCLHFRVYTTQTVVYLTLIDMFVVAEKVISCNFKV